MARFLLALPFLSIFFCLYAFSTETSEELLDKAENAYKAENYVDAQKIYSTLLNSPSITKRSQANLFYNLSNTEFRLGNKGIAYAWLLRAAQIIPFDQDIRHNLNFVRTQLDPQALAVEPSGLLLPSDIPIFLKTYNRVFLVLGLALLAAQFYFLRQRQFNKSLKIFLFSSALFCLLSFAVLLHESNVPLAIMQKSLILRSGPSTSFSEITTLPEGSLVQISGSSDEWYKLSFTTSASPNKTIIGWAEQKALLPLR